MICRALGDAVRGHQIANLLAAGKIHEGPGEERNTKWKRLFNAVAAAQNRRRPTAAYADPEVRATASWAPR